MYYMCVYVHMKCDFSVVYNVVLVVTVVNTCNAANAVTTVECQSLSTVELILETDI